MHVEIEQEKERQKGDMKKGVWLDIISLFKHLQVYSLIYAFKSL